MGKLDEYIAVVGIFQGCLLGLLLLTDSRLSTASRVLGVLCLLIASVFLLPFLLQLPQDSGFVHLTGWVFYLPAAAGALAYLYCRSALLDQPLRAQDLLLFAPFILCLGLGAPTFLADPAAMAIWIDGGQARSWRLPGSELLIFTQAFAYACVTAWMIWRYRRQASSELSNFNPQIFRWLLFLQVVTVLVWILKAIPSFSPAPTLYSDLADLLLVILVYLIALMQWRNAELFTIPNLARLDRAKSTSGDQTSDRAAGGDLDADTRRALLTQVQAVLQERELFLNSELTLADLATEVGLSRHQLSEVLNRHAGKNFYEFINRYRVERACQRLQQDQTARVIDIAFDSGFSSKSTFNALFKQFTGQTPTQYRRTRQGEAQQASRQRA